MKMKIHWEGYKKGGMGVQWWNEEVFYGEMLRKTVGIATPQRYEKGNPTFYHTVYETDKPPIKHKWRKTRRKGESFSGYIDRKLFRLMNPVVIENLNVVNIKFKTFHVVE